MCQRLGWAFAAYDDQGNLLAAARGVPPKWVDTIQGAELWAVQMATADILAPEVVLTDCKAVCSGATAGKSWAT
eukprot:11180380-Karenia_brevis.AAC.1